MEDLDYFVTNFIKSIKNHKLYQKISDTTKEFIKKCYSNLIKTQEELGPVFLFINEDKIMNDSKVLHQDSKRITSVPLFLYRNGIRSLTFLEGINEEELEALITIIASREYSSEVGLLEDLWEAKFPHIIYHAVEKVKKLKEYEDIQLPPEIKSDMITVLHVKINKKDTPKKEEGTFGIPYQTKISINRENASFLLIESIKDLLSYEQIQRKRKSLYLILKESIPKFLAAGNLSALYQTKKLIESIKESKKEFIEISEEIKKNITSEAALQLYIHALTSTSSNRIKTEAVELLESVGIKTVDALINELEITSDFITKDLIISLLKNIFADHREELEVRLVNSKEKAFSILLLIIKKLKDPYFIPCLKELFNKQNSPKIQEVLFSLLPRKEVIQYLVHPETNVRASALEKLKAIWDPEEFEIIRNRIMSKEFWQLPQKEIKTLLELLSTLTTDDTIKIFNTILRKRHFFKEKVYEIKRMSLQALSNIQNEKAIEVISRYKNSRHLKETVAEILKNYERG
jgi:HEAT repeat protein